MKNTLLFPDKSSLDATVGEIPFEIKTTAYESDTDTHWFSTYDDGSNGHPYVDLGLPSRLLWADRNIGAASPEEGGLYFQWGDIVGYTEEQVGTNKQFSGTWSDYKFSTQSDNFTKYNTADGKEILDLEDDAAHVLLGGNWRIPTTEELYELVAHTDIFLVLTDGEEISGNVTTSILDFEFSTTVSTCTGMKIYKKDDHSVYLFIPSSGLAGNGSVERNGVGGYLWSSSVYSPSINTAYNLSFNSSSADGGLDHYGRYNGLPIRGVLSQ